MNLLRMNALLIANRESTAPFSMHNWTWGLFAEQEHVSCNTPACLMGNYAARTDLQDTFFISARGNLELRSRPHRALTDYWDVSFALRQHFDLTDEEVNDLFNGNGCDGAQEDRAKAIAYVEAFIARKLSERPAPDDEEDEEEEEIEEEEISA